VAQAVEYHHYPVDTRPEPTDIVWCLVPYIENGKLKKKERPGLVRAVEFYANRTRARIHVCFGTKNLKEDLREGDLRVTSPTEMAYGGLRFETRFDLDPKREKQWPWATEFFPTPEGYPTPVIRRLHPEALVRLHELTRR